MTRTLKSLLITSVLTLPSIFATSDTLLETESDGNPTVAATVATIATPQPTLLRVSLAPLQLTIGHAEKTFDIGWLNRHDLASLALVSKTFRDLSLPVLTAIKWRSLLVPRVLLQISDPLDETMLTLFKLSLGVTFDNVLNLVLDFRLPIVKLTPETHTKLVDRINNTNTFSPMRKQILIDTLPNATPQDIRRAAEQLYNFGSQHSQNSPERLRYYDNTAASYKLSATHPDATSEDILSAGRRLHDLGVPYYDRAAAVYNLCAVHKNATPRNIISAAHRFYTLGTPYQGRAAKLYELSANHPNATRENILFAADGLHTIGNQYPEGRCLVPPRSGWD